MGSIHKLGENRPASGCRIFFCRRIGGFEKAISLSILGIWESSKHQNCREMSGLKIFSVYLVWVLFKNWEKTALQTVPKITFQKA